MLVRFRRTQALVLRLKRMGCACTNDQNRIVAVSTGVHRTHPTGLCVSPIELADTARNTAAAYGVTIKEGRANVDVSPLDLSMIRVTITGSGPDAGKTYDTKRAYVFAGAQSKEILATSLQRDPRNAALQMPEFDDTYITAISTVRYSHENHPSEPAEGSGHVAQPITLGYAYFVLLTAHVAEITFFARVCAKFRFVIHAPPPDKQELSMSVSRGLCDFHRQLEIPDLIDFQANFSVVAEDYGDVYKTREEPWSLTAHR